MNKCIFLGNLSRDIDLKFKPGSGMAVAKTSIAVQRFKKDDPADFLNLTAFGKTAETMSSYLNKGSKIMVETHVQTGKYQNKEGKTVYTTDFIVDRFEFCGVKSNNTKNTLDEDITPIDYGDSPF